MTISNKEIVDLARLSLAGNSEDIVMFIKRLAYHNRNVDREFADQLTALLPKGSFNVLREEWSQS